MWEVRPSRHAIHRWHERFPGHDLCGQYNSARKGTKRQRTALQHRLGWRRPGTYYLFAPCGAVFVCAAKHFILTVLPAQEESTP